MTIAYFEGIASYRIKHGLSKEIDVYFDKSMFEEYQKMLEIIQYRPVLRNIQKTEVLVHVLYLEDFTFNIILV